MIVGMRKALIIKYYDILRVLPITRLELSILETIVNTSALSFAITRHRSGYQRPFWPGIGLHVIFFITRFFNSTSNKLIPVFIFSPPLFEVSAISNFPLSIGTVHRNRKKLK